MGLVADFPVTVSTTNYRWFGARGSARPSADPEICNSLCATPHSRVVSGGHFSCWCVCARLAAVAAAWKGHAFHLLR